MGGGRGANQRARDGKDLRDGKDRGGASVAKNLHSKLRFSTCPYSCSCSCSCSGTALPSMLAGGSETRTWFAADGWAALHEQKQEQKRE
jgi:hypothetical protein